MKKKVKIKSVAGAHATTTNIEARLTSGSKVSKRKRCPKDNSDCTDLTHCPSNWRPCSGLIHCGTNLPL